MRVSAKEQAIEQRVCRWAERNGWLQFKFETPGRRAAPDRIFIKDGQIVFIEFKAPGKTPRLDQWEFITDLRLECMHAEYADGVEIAQAILQGLVSIPAPDDRSHPGTREMRTVG